ncbi:MAG: glycosyltransferase [Planctomycetes bacterium]|nr:glycosyltransferase [Planctomycetota bacterium]
MPDCLGLFAKYWQPGQVKTRLAATIGDAAAADAYQQFVVTLLNRLQNLGNQRWLAFAPPERAGEFESVAAERWQLEPQAEGDLGQRMQTFFANRLAEGCQRIVLLGTDSPNVPVEYVQQALIELRNHDVVLGPTEDGGYWLVGVSTDVPEIFTDIPWSTPNVWQATLEALRSRGRAYTTVPTWYDIDENDDLQRLIADLQADDDPELRTLLRNLLSR